MRFIRSLLILLLFGAATPLAAQEDILTGRITGTDGRPVIGARVEVVSAETEISRSVVTDANGRYMMVFPDGGGRYLMRVTYLGLADAVQAVVRNAEEELLITNVVMQPKAIELSAINVTAQRPPPSQEGAGEQSTAMTQDMLNRLPLPDLDPATIALLAAGVTGTGADSVSGRLGFSVAGMSDLLNQVTLDGVILGEGGLGVPEEGVRRTQVTTSTFDASRGGFAGGQVSMQTARGNNRNGGSLSYTMDSDALQMSSSAQTNGFSTHRLGGSWGGPLIRNRLFYNGSFQLGRTTNYMFALAANDPLAAQRSGVSPDSIGRFLGILENDYGFPVTGQTGAYNQLRGDYRLQGRLDWTVLQRPGQSHTMSLSANRSVQDQDSTRISALDLAQHGGDTENNNQLLRLSLSSRFQTRWTNNLNVSFSERWSNQIPYVELPEGRVRVTSEFDDGTRATNTLVFGGNRSMPREAYGRDLQVSDDLSLLLPVGGQIHRIKVGGSIQQNKDVSRQTDNVFGSFSFASLEDFQANRPDRYDRSLTERRARTASLNTGIYIGDTWRISMPLEVTLGLRYDHSQLDQTPERNPLIEQLFGRRTDITPAMGGFSPRAGFNYRLNQQGEPPKSISGGLGLFAGRAPINIFSEATRQTGLPSAEARLICIGSAVPVPDWDRYLEDPSSLPETCLDGGTGTSDLSSRAPTVTLIDPDQSLPSSVRADIGYRTQLPRNFTGNFRYTYSLGMGLWGYRDLNLNEAQTFTLAHEDRPFFGDPSAIVQRTGATTQASSRSHEELGSVYDVLSDRESRAHQATATVNGMLWDRLTLMLNYTLGFSRDQASGSFSQATTAGNPNDVEWSTSSNDRRHTMNLVMALAVTPWMELSMTPRLSSGSPFTPMVDRDINGDGARNDRAFVFNPAAAPDTAIANGMTRLLSNVPGRVQDCIQSQLGRIADRNSCRNSWTQSFDMRLSLRPNLPTLQRRLTLSLDARNVLTGLDQTINGRDDMKGWGGGQRADQDLLQVRGFDPVTNAFEYQVNEGFGQTRRGPQARRAPFSITLSGRMTLGGQPQMSNRGFGGRGGMGGMGGMGGFGGGFGGGPDGGRGGRGAGGVAGLGDMMAAFRDGAANVDSLLAAVITHPLGVVPELKDSLGLSVQQMEVIAPIIARLDEEHTARRASLKPIVEAMIAESARGGQPNQQQMMQQVQLQIQPNLEGARRETAEAATLIQRELTAEQWQKLPEAVRAAQQTQQRPGGGFNAVALLDRMLANPIPLILELKDSLQLSAEQVAQVEKISTDLQIMLAERRAELGRRFDGVEPQQQGQIYQQIQPDIERTRGQVTAALEAVEKALTKEQWEKIPQQIRTPFAQQQRRGRD